MDRKRLADLLNKKGISGTNGRLQVDLDAVQAEIENAGKPRRSPAFLQI
jgi:hypothetical protein